MAEDTSVIHVAPTLHPRAGGPARVVIDLATSLASRRDMSVHLVSQGLAGEPMLRAGGHVQEQIRVTTSRTALRIGWPVLRQLSHMNASPRSGVMHTHGLWTAATHWAVAWAARTQTPLVLQPHGMLHPWALHHKGYKKKIAMRVYQRRDLHDAAVLIATSDEECEFIRQSGFMQPIALVPNGVDLVPGEPRRKQQHDSVRTALFLSRIHPVKGLLNLVQAWGRVRPAGWQLVLAGPDEDGHLAEVTAAVRRERIEDCVRFVGEVGAEAKSQLFCEADLFILPTHSENFGVVVAEALSFGVPVITTRGAPWSGLETHRCGWWVPVGAEPLEPALRAATSLTDSERLAMGQRGREYVRRFERHAVAGELAAVYRWVLGAGDRPQCVHTA